MLAAASAQATPFELVYSGTFSTDEALNLQSSGSPTFFSAVTPFTITALFDTSSTNYAPSAPPPPFAGFRAYAPTSATIDIGGQHFSIESIAANPLAGVTVAIFDKASFTPGRYGIGLIADPVHDGAGFVGDFSSATPDYTAGALTPTVFGGYNGVGFGSGVCLTPGSPETCTHAVTPWVLHDSSHVAWNLTFGNYSVDYPVGGLNTASITAAVPEPSTYGLMLAGLIGIGLATRRRRAISPADR